MVFGWGNRLFLLAAYFDSDLQMVSYRANAFDVQMAGARRLMCSGFITLCYQLSAQLPGFIAPRTDEMDTGVSETIMMATKKEVKDSCAAPARRVRQADE